MHYQLTSISLQVNVFHRYNKIILPIKSRKGRKHHGIDDILSGRGLYSLCACATILLMKEMEMQTYVLEHTILRLKQLEMY